MRPEESKRESYSPHQQRAEESKNESVLVFFSFPFPTGETPGSRSRERPPEICLVFVCDEDERVVGRQAAPGACPYCSGAVQAVDVESQWRFCFLPFYFRTKRKFYCSVCARRLVTQY